MGCYHLGNIYFGDFHIWFVETEELEVSDIEDMQEISLEEYNDAMRKFTEQVIELKWFADHDRNGGKWPTDPDFQRQGGDEYEAQEEKEG